MNVSNINFTTEFCYLFNTEEELNDSLLLLRKLKNKNGRYPWMPKEIKGLSMFLIDNYGFENKDEFLTSYLNSKGTDYPVEIKKLKYKAGLKFFIDLSDLTDFDSNKILVNTDFQLEERKLEGCEALEWVRNLYLFNLIVPNILLESMQPYNQDNLIFHDKDCVVNIQGNKYEFKKGDIQIGYPDFTPKDVKIADILENYFKQKSKDPMIEAMIKRVGYNPRT